MKNLVTFENFEYVSSDIIPEEYEKVAAGFNISYYHPEGYWERDREFDFYASGDDLSEDVQLMIMNKDNAVSSEGCKCNICNHVIKNAVYFKNKKDSNIIIVGFDCSKSIMKYNFDVKNAKKQNLKSRREQDTKNRIAEILANHPELESNLNVNHKIVSSIAEKFYTHGYISDKQIDLVNKLANERLAYEKTSVKCPTGVVNDEFILVSTKTSVNSTSIKPMVLLQHKDGWKIYGSVDKFYDKVKIESYGGGWGKQSKSFQSGKISDDFQKLVKGMKIKITADVTPTEKDPYFGMFKKLKTFEIIS